MKFTGAWYNPDYSGEGLSITENPVDGTVIAYFYSYRNDGSQMWIEGNGKRVGDTAILDGRMPIGGGMHNKVLLKSVDETPWGQITLIDRGDKIEVRFPTISYLVQPVYVVGAPVPVPTPVPVPEPEPTPVPVPEPEPEPTTQIMIEKWLQAGDKSRWLDMGQVPLLSSAPVYKSRIGNTSYNWTKHRITAINGSQTITQVNVSGPDHPKIVGISKGQVLQVGVPAEFDLYVGPATATSGWAQSNYGIWTKELGEIYRVSAQVMYEL